MFGEKHWNRGAIKCLDTLMEGMVSNDDSITVSSTWELPSVYMRYSQGDGVNTSLYIGLCTVPMFYSLVCLRAYSIVLYCFTHGTIMCCLGR